MKAKVNMTKWELYLYQGHYNLSGYADSHPRLGKNAWIQHTSSMVSFSLENDILTYETRNTVYICPLKYMSCHPYQNVVMSHKKYLMHVADESDSALDRIIAATACIALEKKRNKLANYIRKLQELGMQELTEMEEKDNQRMFEIAKNYEDCLYIEMSDIDNGGKAVYHMDGQYGVIEPYVHVGMFQDSVLYMEAEMLQRETEEPIDFRYFPRGFNSMESYGWSSNVKNLVIKNESSEKISFDHEEIEVGETKVFKKDESRK